MSGICIIVSIDVIQNIYEQDYYDYENLYRGLEKLYISLGRYNEAVDQTKLLLQFYNRRYKDSSELFSMVGPTTVRLGDNLFAADRVAEAKRVFESALKMTKDRNLSTSQLEQHIRNVSQKKRTSPSTVATTLQFVVPESNKSFSTTKSPQTTKDVLSIIYSISLPGLRIEKLKEAEKIITIYGDADTNKIVAEFLQEITANGLRASLLSVTKQKRVNISVSVFIIKVSY